MSERRKKIGVFGGSFNPIHIGHTSLANWICEYAGIDEVWFVVSPLNPLKDGLGMLSDIARMDMVRKAIAGYDRFAACDVEMHMPRPSYMVNTLSKLREEHPMHDFILIIGADNWDVFDRWHGYREILASTEILIYRRTGVAIDISTLPEIVRLLETPVIEISSSFIRTAIAGGHDVRYFLHPDVWAAIERHGYYKKTSL